MANVVRPLASCDNKDDSDYVPIEEPKGSLRRLWSEKDEITLLKALKNQSNKSDMMELFNSVNTSLEANVSKSQLSDKVRKLRNKFKKSIVDVALLEGHQANVYKLCEQLWGGGCAAAAAAGDEDRRCVAAAGIDDHTRMIELDFAVNYPRMVTRLQHLYPANITGEGYKTIMKLMMTYLSQEELEGMEKKWVELYLEEIRVIGTKRMLLMEEQLDLIEKARETHKNQIEN